MQELEHIGVGQAANDGTGDPLRDGMAKVNENFSKVQAGVDAVEQTEAETKGIATAAKTIADAAVPATQKGMAGGVAPLDATGKVPAEHLPALADYIPVDQKGAPDGVAPLDAGGKVPAANLPAAEDSIPLTQKGVAGGVATLDNAGQVPVSQLGGAVKAADKGVAGGVATLDSGGKVPAGQLPPIPTGPAVGTPAWWPSRVAIPAGQVPLDGQTITRATFPDLTAMVVGGKLPVVPEADWLADPLKRGSYTLGDGSTTIRLPDMNGKAAGSVAAVVLRGDGALSAGTAGAIQRDALQNITGSVSYRNLSDQTAIPTIASGAAVVTPASGPAYARILASVGGEPSNLSVVSLDASRVARTAVETRGTNVTGVWTVHAFGAVTNPGAADAAQLASDYAALNAAFQSLDGQISFAMLTPNGGSPIAPNSRYVLANPFPGFLVIVVAEMLFTGGWSETGWFTDSGGAGGASRAWGVKGGQESGGSIVIQTGISGLSPGTDSALGGKAASGALASPIQCRVRVYKIKGAVS